MHSNPATVDSERRESGRGRKALRPSHIPLRGWRDILIRVYRAVGADNLSLVSAGVAFYSLLAVFPALTATISVYGLVFGPRDVTHQLAEIAGVVPGDARNLMLDQLQDVTATDQSTLGVGLVLSLALTIWAASKGASSLFAALNIVYGESEDRGFIRLTALSMLFTVAGVLFLASALGLIALAPVVLERLGLAASEEMAVSWARWPVMAVGVLTGLAAVYRYGPSRKNAKWVWISWGAALATALWLAASALFSLYVTSFANYNETYGGLAAVVALMMWFYLTAYLVLLGGELNAEMEHQTRHDTTTGAAQPMGQRGAYVADTLGEVPKSS